MFIIILFTLHLAICCGSGHVLSKIKKEDADRKGESILFLFAAMQCDRFLDDVIRNCLQSS